MSKRRIEQKRVHGNEPVSGNQLSKEELLEAALKQQEEIDIYNLDLLLEVLEGNTNPFYKGFKPNNILVFKPFLESYVKAHRDGQIEEYNIRQIDARVRSTDNEVYVPTPFPFLNIGILLTDYKDDFISIDKHTIVLTRDILWKNNRFYENRLAEVRDYVRNQENHSLASFEGSFRFYVSNVDGTMSLKWFVNNIIDEIVCSLSFRNKAVLDKYNRVKELANEL